jgi:hypothetical protein
VDEEAELVHQPGADQGVDEADAAGRHDVPARCGLEGLDVLSQAAAEDGAVLPPGVRHGGRDGVLRNRVEVSADAGPVVRQQRPVAAHLLEGHAADEERVRRLTLLAQRLLEIAAIDVVVRRPG